MGTGGACIGRDGFAFYGRLTGLHNIGEDELSANAASADDYLTIK